MQQQRQEQESKQDKRAIPWWRDGVPESSLPPVEVNAPTEVSLSAFSEQQSAPETDLLAEHHDLWAELEAEAQRRALLANNETVIPLNMKREFRACVVSLFCVWLVFLPAVVVLVSLLSPKPPYLPFIIWMSMFQFGFYTWLAYQ